MEACDIEGIILMGLCAQANAANSTSTSSIFATSGLALLQRYLDTRFFLLPLLD
jgi:hypothetical protein